MAKDKFANKENFGIDPQSSQEQMDRIERKFHDFVEAFLDGTAHVEIQPLAPRGTVADRVGSITVVNGFAIRLRKD